MGPSPPLGYASSACTRTAKTRFDANTPAVYVAAWFDSWRTLTSEAKPTAASSRPKRPYSRTRNAATPAPTNVRQTSAASRDCATGLGAILLTAMT